LPVATVRTEAPVAALVLRFSQQAVMRHLGALLGEWYGVPRGLGVLMITVLGLGLVCLLVPRMFVEPRVRLSEVRWFLAYFAAIGLGFMLVEIGFLQRFSIFLGHPTYSLSIVLFSLILSTGLGSLISDYVRLDTRGTFSAWAIATGGYLVSQTIWVPPLLLSLDSSSLVISSIAATVLEAGTSLV
jgi:hypothetical protein